MFRGERWLSSHISGGKMANSHFAGGKMARGGVALEHRHFVKRCGSR